MMGVDIKTPNKITMLQFQKLLESAEHWIENLEAIWNDNPDDYCRYAWGCPCCRTFWDRNCDGCPVKQYTGFPECAETPWIDTPDFGKGYNVSEADILACIDEYRFLVSLALDSTITDLEDG